MQALHRLRGQESRFWKEMAFPVLLTLIVPLLIVPAHAHTTITFDWDDLPGAGNPRSITESGITMTSTYLRFGGANGHEFVDDFELFPNLGSFGSDSMIGIPSSFDDNGTLNGGPGLLNAYTIFRITFSTPIKAPELLFKDIDESDASPPTWQDFVSVRGFLGGPAIYPTYSLDGTGHQQLATIFGDEGVLGIDEFNTANFGEDGSSMTATFAPGDVIDQLDIVFHQGLSNRVDDHAILLSDVTVTEVPEPTGLLAAAGVKALLMARRRMRKKQ